MVSIDARYADPELPAVDDRLVAPDCGFEILDGALVDVAPADQLHATRHSKLSALVEAHAGLAFDVAVDMLTRTSRTSDVAPDVSVFPIARDPVTGGRQLEQLAFEIVSTESLGHAGDKAARLVVRGVRRVFAIDVERARALEWSRELGTWSMLDPSGQLEDPALAAPLPIEAMVHAAKADDAIARALVIKRNPVIEAVRAEGQAEGKREGLAEGKREGLAEGKREGLAEGKLHGRAEALLAILIARGVAINPGDRAQILGERDPGRLDRWLARAASCGAVAELLADPVRMRDPG
jgi:Putative restriction endonuclease/Essential protein Yae1, N terminal